MPGRTGMVGGHVVLDFVNTVAWRPDPSRAIERITDFPALLGWARQAALIDDDAAATLATAARGDRASAERATRRTRKLRESLHAILTETAAGRPPPAPDLLALRSALLKALTRAVPRWDMSLGWHLRPQVPDDIPHLLAIASLEFLQSPELAVLRRCQNSACGWLFLDRSRSHTRRWCSSAECGNRDRVRRYAARRRSTRD